jgi:glycosyltransferase involved in cell wall biosynthesis
MYCMRGGKYNYFTRASATGPPHGVASFPAWDPRPESGRPFPSSGSAIKPKNGKLNLTANVTASWSIPNIKRRSWLATGLIPPKSKCNTPVHDAQAIERAASSFDDRNLVLFVGQVIRGKGVDLLLRALAKVRVPFQASIVGEGNHRPYCERLCARLG